MAISMPVAAIRMRRAGWTGLAAGRGGASIFMTSQRLRRRFVQASASFRWGAAGWLSKSSLREAWGGGPREAWRSEEHTSELQSLMRISYAVFCLKKKIKINHQKHTIKLTQTT